jgi:inward rectifier potassium channel
MSLRCLSELLQPHAVANVAPGSLSDAFFFSVETLATVGYGVIAPASTYGHIVASCELTCGLAFIALLTGLIFVRFSRIKAKVAFADKVVIARHDGHPTLMTRVAYDRAGLLADFEARLTFMRFMRTTGGRSFRHSGELVLTRSRLALLVLTWTIMHEIDTAGPLSGLTTEKLVETDARLIVTIKARNMAAGAEVFDMAVYTAEQILFGMNYQDVVTSGDATHINADLRELNLVEPDIEPDAS